jgi:cytoskeletal protein RodZ
MSVELLLLTFPICPRLTSLNLYLSSNSLRAHLLMYLHLFKLTFFHLKMYLLLPQFHLRATTITHSKTKTHKSKSNIHLTANDMENNKISEGSSTTDDKKPGMDSPTSEICIQMPPEPMGTRPCSPSESDISDYALPPPAYHASWNVLPAAPAPATIPTPAESVPAQSVSPAAISNTIMAPAPPVTASTPAAVQSSSIATPAQPTSASTRGPQETFDVESMGDDGRRHIDFLDNAPVRGVRRAGEWSFSCAVDLAKRAPLLFKVMIIVMVVDLWIFLIYLVLKSTSH